MTKPEQSVTLRLQKRQHSAISVNDMPPIGGASPPDQSWLARPGGGVNAPQNDMLYRHV